MTEEQQKWYDENVKASKDITIVDMKCHMLILNNGNIVVGKSKEEAIEMERKGTGEVIPFEGFETDEINSLLWDE